MPAISAAKTVSFLQTILHSSTFVLVRHALGRAIVPIPTLAFQAHKDSYVMAKTEACMAQPSLPSETPAEVPTND